MKIDNSDCYGPYMRLTHILALCFGLPITRRQIKTNDRFNGESDVQGHRYSFDLRIVPVWLAYMCLDMFIMYYNYLEGASYVGESFKKCFEESYCFAVIELFNRNIGPFTILICSMFYGHRNKVAALAGTERILRFLRETSSDDDDSGSNQTGLGPNRAAPNRPGFGSNRTGPGSNGGGVKTNFKQVSAEATVLSPVAKYYSVVIIIGYASCIWLYTIAVPATVIALYCLNALGQTSIYNLVQLQYHVLERGYARVNQLVESMNVLRDQKSAKRSLVRLTDTYDELCMLVEHLNHAYTPGMLCKWPYSVVRLIMVVFRIIELSTVIVHGHPLAVMATVLIFEHVGEIFLFLLQTMYFCMAGSRLSNQATRTSASLQKLKLYHGSNLDMEFKKLVNIFRIRVNCKKVNPSIGGFIMINMNLIEGICGIIVTYFLVLIQFKQQKGHSKPLHNIWD